VLKLLAPTLALVLVIAVAFLAERPGPRADFVFINRGDANTLDLHQMSWMQDLRLAHVLYEGLVRLDVFSWDYHVVPGVAESWEASPDGRVYTFHLRADARWSNGEPVRAGDFLFSWRRGLLPEVGCDYIGQLQLIKGARAFSEWRAGALEQLHGQGGGREAAEALWRQTQAKFTELVGAVAPDDRTLRVELEHPTPYFLDLCAFPAFFPVYPALVEAYTTIDATTGQSRVEPGWTKPPTLVTNGPFELASWRFKRDMRFEANPHYWNARSLNIRSIAVPSIEDGNAAVLAFQTGAADWVSDVTPEYRAEMWARKRAFHQEHATRVENLRAQGLDQFEIDRRLPRDPRANIHVVQAFGTYWINFNCLERLRDGRVNPLRDPRVRRALAMAVDKAQLCDEVLRCGERPARTIIPPGSIAGYRSPAGLAFDPSAARALLREAGHADGAALGVIEILYNKDGIHDKIAQAVAKDWEKHLGLSIRLDVQEIKVFRDELKNQNYMASRGGWYGDYGDPTTFLDLHRKDDGNNDRKYASDRFEGLLNRALDEADAGQRLGLLGEAERILVDEDLPVLPLFHYVSIYQFDAHRVSGINCHPRTTQLMGLVDVLGDGVGSDVPRGMPARP
jgi:oligopeptide transport system substrate-binding protein